MVEEIAPTLAAIKKNLRTQTTKKYEWRAAQLRAFLTGYSELRKEIEEAIFLDLGRNANASIAEYKMCQSTAEHDLKHLKTYMKDVSEDTELLLAPASTYIRYEPMGVCAIYSAWNYPIMTAIKPLI
jgi:aldehyde dehydrogenase (NAD+)